MKLFSSAIVCGALLLSACVSSNPQKDQPIITISENPTFPKATVVKFKHDCLITPMAIMKSPDIPVRRLTLTREFVETGKGTPKDNLFCRFENARLGEVLRFIDDNDLRKICPRVHVLNHGMRPSDDEMVAVSPKLALACAPE